MSMMTDVRQLDEQVLRDLAHRPVNAPCVSLYLAPTRGSVGRQATIDTLKSLRHQAASMLAEPRWGLAEPAIDALLDPAIAQLTATTREPYEGLACFVDDDGCHVVVAPSSTPSEVTVSTEPDLVPLVVALASQLEFDLLILSQRRVQLFHCSANELVPMTRYELPESQDDALRVDLNESNAGPLDRGSTYKDERKEAVERFVQIVERRLPPSVREGRRPLVVAAVDFEAALFAKTSTHRRLIRLTDLGSPEHLAPSKVHAAAVALVEQDGMSSLLAVRERYLELAGTGRTLSEPDEMQQAADEGRVDTLLVAPEPFDGDAARAGLVNATLRTGGHVVPVSPTTNGTPRVAAILRY